MNIKAILFAGTGLFLSCTATAIWVGHDMADIRARAEAKHAAACAAQRASATTGQPLATGETPVLDANTGQPVVTPASDASSTAAKCAPDGAAGATGSTSDPNAVGTTSDPYATQGSDITTGAAPSIDPETGQPSSSDTYSDQYSGDATGSSYDDADGALAPADSGGSYDDGSGDYPTGNDAAAAGAAPTGGF